MRGQVQRRGSKVQGAVAEAEFGGCQVCRLERSYSPCSWSPDGDDCPLLHRRGRRDVAADDGAFDRGRQGRYPSSPRPGTRLATGVVARPGRLTGRERKRRLLLADDGCTNRPRHRARREARLRSPSPPAGPARRCSSPTISVRAARDQRQVRGGAAERHPLVEHPLQRPAGQSRRRAPRMTVRSYHRFTVTIGIASMPRRRRRRAPVAGGALPNSARARTMARRRSIASRGEPLASHLDGVDAPVRYAHPRERRRPHLAAAAGR